MNRSTLWFRYWPMVAVGLGLYVWGNAWLSIGLYHLGLVTFIAVQRKRLREVPWRSPAGLSLGLYGMGLLAAPFVVYALPLLLGGEAGAILRRCFEELGLTGISLVAFVIYFSTIHPILEEAGWRAALKTTGKRPHLHDFEFAGYHLLVLHYVFPGKWLVLLGTLVLLVTSAWLWRQLRDHRGMTAVITFHAAADLAILLAVLWSMR